VQKILGSFNKNPSMSQKYGETICAWIIVQICVLHGQKAKVCINVGKLAIFFRDFVEFH
jgi:hypothetical protein